MENVKDYITVNEYAELKGRDASTIRYKINRGTLKTGIKIGGIWLINKNEPYVDNRCKSGEYKDWRNKINPPTKEDAVLMAMEKNGLPKEVCEHDYELGYLTVNKGFNGVWYIWYLDDSTEWAVDKKGKELSAEEIEKYLA